MECTPAGVVALPYLYGAHLAPSVNDNLVRSEFSSPGLAFAPFPQYFAHSSFVDIQRQGSLFPTSLPLCVRSPRPVFIALRLHVRASVRAHN